MDDRTRRILTRLQNRCSKCECCSSDIYRKAVDALRKDAGGDADMEDVRKRASEIMESLVSDKFVDDLRYASAFAREKSAISGWGAVKIRFALAAKQIPEDVIRKALSEIDGERAGDRLEGLMAAKWKTLTGPDGQVPQDARLKLIRYALSRGYEYDEVKDVVADITRNG